MKLIDNINEFLGGKGRGLRERAAEERSPLPLHHFPLFLNTSQWINVQQFVVDNAGIERRLVEQIFAL